MNIKPPFASVGKFLLALFVAGGAANAVHAQLVTAGLPGQRVFGQRSIEVGVAHINPSVPGLDRNGSAVGVAVHSPVGAYVDVGAAFGAGAIRASGGRLRDKAFTATAVVHPAAEGVRPFLGVIAGHEWMEQRLGTLRSDDRAGFWGVGAGLEVPFGRLTTSASFTYVDTPERASPTGTHYNLHADYAFTARVSGVADVTLADFAHQRGQMRTFRVGARWRF